MEFLKKLISDNTEILTILSLVIGLLGIVLAIIFYVKSKRKKTLTYEIYGYNVINEYQSKIKNLEIKYKKKPIENLSLSKIAIWNSGNVTINRDEIVELSPILIKMKNEEEILDIKLIKQTENSNNFKLIKNINSWKVDFDYIDKNEGCLLGIVHTGNLFDDIQLNGKIKGGKIIVNEQLNSDNFSSIVQEPTFPDFIKYNINSYRKYGVPIFTILLIISTYFTISKFSYWWLAILLFSLFGIYSYYPKNKRPKGLK